MNFKYVPSIPTFLRVCIKKRCWILSNAFSASIDRIIWFFSLLVLMWCITLIDLQMLNQSCGPGMNPTWSWQILFICCWIQLAGILLRIFTSLFLRDTGLLFSFFFFLLGLWLGNQRIAGFMEWVWKFSFLIFWKSLRRIGIISALNVWLIPHGGHLVLDSYLLGDFW